MWPHVTFCWFAAFLLPPNSLVKVRISSTALRRPAVPITSQCGKKQGMTDRQTEGQDGERKSLKWRDTGAESFWPIRQRSYQWVTMAEWLLYHSTCRGGSCWDLLNRFDRNFLRCLMELTLSYLRAISVRALYAKRQSTSVDLAFAKKAPPQPFQCVLDHRWVID